MVSVMSFIVYGGVSGEMMAGDCSGKGAIDVLMTSLQWSGLDW